MVLFRVVHDKNNPYLVINTSISLDARLSWKAKGIWLYAFSKPNDWYFCFNDLLKRSTDSRHSLASGIKELIKFGYLEKHRKKDEKGKFLQDDWNFFERPKKTEEVSISDSEDFKDFQDFQDSPREIKKNITTSRFSAHGESPQSGNPHADNQHLLSNDLTNKERKEKNKEKKNVSQKNPDVSQTSLRLSSLLFEKLKKRDPKAKEPNLSKWAIHIERLIRIDGRDEEEIEEMIEWACEHPFWKGNILSTESLRESFGKLVQKKHAEEGNKNKKTPEEMLAEKKVETEQENKRWGAEFLKDKKFDNENLFMELQDNSIFVRANKDWKKIGFLEEDFKEMVEKAYSKII